MPLACHPMDGSYRYNHYSQYTSLKISAHNRYRATHDMEPHMIKSGDIYTPHAILKI